MPVDDIVRALRPRAPRRVLEAASRLEYRAVVVLALVLEADRVSSDHWIYFPSPEVGFCRLHEPANWSPHMTPEGRTALVLEYFCREGDERWSQPRCSLVDEAEADLQATGLVSDVPIRSARMVRLPRAYPLYRVGYRNPLETVTDYLDRFENLQRVGRNATFLYTSSDHYIDMGLKAAENLLGGDHDLAAVGRDPKYAEVWQEGEGWD